MANYQVEGGMLAYPHKLGDYSYRVPTPPRIVVPPPSLDSNAVPDISIQALQSSSHAFLSAVDYENLVKQNAPIEWTYERRREAQRILPYLCLGPMTAAKDEPWLQEEGITMMLGVRQKHDYTSKLMNSALRVAERLGIEHHTVDLASNQDLIQAFPATTQLINQHLARNFSATSGASLGKVLVFCECGNERSAGVVAAYLMETHQDVDFIKAMQLCQAQRFCVNFDDGMKRLLQGYWDILCARRAVAGQTMDDSVTPSEGDPSRKKRGLDRRDDDDEEMEMDGQEQDDAERFGGRTFAPFMDQSL